MKNIVSDTMALNPGWDIPGVVADALLGEGGGCGSAIRRRMGWPWVGVASKL